MIKLHYIEGKKKNPLFEEEVAKLEQLAKEYEPKIKEDIVIAFGGDGTFDEAANDYDLPVLFIKPSKSRSAAVLSDNSFKDINNCLEKLASGDYFVQNLPRIEAFLNGKSIGSVFGDLWVSRGQGLNTIEMALEVEYVKGNKEEKAMKHWYDVVKSDGIVIGLPPAATSYNWSLGGDLVDWDAKVVGVKYMAPTKTMAGKQGYYCGYEGKEIRIKFAGWEGEHAEIRLDWMDEGIPIKYGDEIVIKEAEKITKLIRINPEPLYEKHLRREISHSDFNSGGRKYKRE